MAEISHQHIRSGPELSPHQSQVFSAVGNVVPGMVLETTRDAYGLAGELPTALPVDELLHNTEAISHLIGQTLTGGERASSLVLQGSQVAQEELTSGAHFLQMVILAGWSPTEVAEACAKAQYTFSAGETRALRIYEEKWAAEVAGHVHEAERRRTQQREIGGVAARFMPGSETAARQRVMDLMQRGHQLTSSTPDYLANLLVATNRFTGRPAGAFTGPMAKKLEKILPQ